MNDEYQERGLFKQLVLILFGGYVWCAVKIERLWDSEAFWWWVAGFFFAVGVYLLGTILK